MRTCPLLFIASVAIVACSEDDATPPDAGPATDVTAAADAAPAPAPDAPTAAEPDASVEPDAGVHADAEPRVFTLVDHSLQLDRTSSITTDMAIADVNGDRVPDVVWLKFLGPAEDDVGRIDVAINDGAAHFTTLGVVSSTVTRGDTWRYVRAADMDRDGDVDLVVTRGAVQLPQVGLLLNDGSGRFTEDVLALPPSDGDVIGLCYGPPVVADFDGNGYRDIALPIFSDASGRVDARNVLFLNARNRQFTVASRNYPAISDNQDFTTTMAAGDLDGDDDVDLYVGEAQAQQRILRNDGTGVFSDVTSLVIGRLIYYPGSTSLTFDVDDDGDLDIVTTAVDDRPGPASFVLINDGRGRFEGQPLPTRAASSAGFDVTVGDVDHDNRFDVLWCNYHAPSDPPLELAHLGEDGTWQPVPIRHPLRESLLAVELGDLDGDGDLDLVASSTRTRFLLLSE